MRPSGRSRNRARSPAGAEAQRLCFAQRSRLGGAEFGQVFADIAEQGGYFLLNLLVRRAAATARSACRSPTRARTDRRSGPAASRAHRKRRTSAWLDEHDLAVRPPGTFLGPEVEVAQRAQQGLADPVQALSAGVHEPHPLAQPGRKGLPDHGVLPDVVIVEQVPARRLLRVVGAQEAPAQPGHRRQRAAERERRLRPAQRLGGRAVPRDRPELARQAMGHSSSSAASVSPTCAPR